MFLSLLIQNNCIEIRERLKDENEMEEQIFFGVINSENKKVDKKTLKLTAT